MSKKVCLFCGANAGNSEFLIEQAKLLCDELIQQDMGLVYGGGKYGMMGIVADKFIEAGKEVIGIRPERLINNEDVHDNLTELIVTKDMYDRKAKMVELSDYFIALPGGVGTLDEIIETFTLFKIGYIRKPSGLLNTDQFFDGLDQLLARMTQNGFLSDQDRKELIIEAEPKKLLELLGIKG